MNRSTSSTARTHFARGRGVDEFEVPHSRSRSRRWLFGVSCLPTGSSFGGARPFPSRELLSELRPMRVGPLSLVPVSGDV